MRKAERLFQLLTALRGRRLAVTAQTLAMELDVSVRTIYRDITALQNSGVPIDGEAGIGYRLQAGFHLPPLMFDADEIEALLLGIRMAQAWSDRDLASAATRALQKIEAALPESRRDSINSLVFTVPDFHVDSAVAERNALLRNAIKQQRLIEIDYIDVAGVETQRRLEPSGLVYWGKVWTLVAWCHLRRDFRDFRLDRMQRVEVLDAHFAHSPTLRMREYLQRVCSRQECSEHAAQKACRTLELIRG